MQVMPKVEHCIKILLSIFASSFFTAVLLAIIMGCMLPAMWVSGETRCPSGAYMFAAKHKTNTEMDLCVPWPNGFPVCNNTSHPAQWMASVLNVHPCISQAILPLSCWRSEATIKCRQPNSRVCSLTCNLVYEDESGKRCKR